MIFMLVIVQDEIVVNLTGNSATISWTSGAPNHIIEYGLLALVKVRYGVNPRVLQR